MNSTQRIKHRAEITALKDKIRGIIQFETNTENLSYIDIVGILEWVKLEMFDEADYTEDEEE